MLGSGELLKTSWTDLDAIGAWRMWIQEPCSRWGPDPPQHMLQTNAFTAMRGDNMVM